MKKYILALLGLSLGTFLFAQKSVKQGEIVYEETRKLNFNFEGMTDEMKARLPKERKSIKILYFNEETSSYQASKEQAGGPPPGMRGGGGGMHGGGMGMRMMMSGGGADDKVYLNFTENIKVEQKEFMSRIFLIEGEPSKDNWKLSSEQKMILDYPCMQASQITENDTILAWFTPAIPVPAGPSNYVNLPGLVLEVDINNGNRVLKAQSIDLKELEKDLIAKPKKGKKVTREEFRKIVDEKTKEMGGENQGGQRVITIHG